MAEEKQNEKNLEQLLKELSEIKQDFSSFKNDIEEATPSKFRDYLTTFFIISTGLYSIVRSSWWIYQRLTTKKNLDDMMVKLDHLPKKNKNKDKK